MVYLVAISVSCLGTDYTSSWEFINDLSSTHFYGKILSHLWLRWRLMGPSPTWDPLRWYPRVFPSLTTLRTEPLTFHPHTSCLLPYSSLSTFIFCLGIWVRVERERSRVLCSSSTKRPWTGRMCGIPSRRLGIQDLSTSYTIFVERGVIKQPVRPCPRSGDPKEKTKSSMYTKVKNSL